jgi:coenzyme F420-reducing hydrogenase beta subunit
MSGDYFMIELVKEKQNCCGCSACMCICPKLAISMIPDEEGFLYPTINVDLCIECGLCQKVCSFQNGYDTSHNLTVPLAYAVKHSSDDVRKQSTSGGMFTALSDEILSRDGVIYGVGFDENLVVCHKKAINANERDLFRGSKYVQSEMRQTIREIELDLRNDKYVLFTGTPCQTVGVREYLSTKKVPVDNLLLCDILCLGTPSPLIFSDYLKFCEGKKGKKISHHVFRSKQHGWHNHTEINIFEDQEIDSKSYISQLFKTIFHSHTILRPACHNCKYTNLKRPSDITIADYWGIEKTYPAFDDNQGISLTLLNTEKGKTFFESCKSKLLSIEGNSKECLRYNMNHPTKPSPMRESVWKAYHTKGFEYIIRNYYGYGIKGYPKRIIVSLLKKTNLMATVKKVLGRH